MQATTAGDLSCGTLYGAVFEQLDDVNGGNFSIDWLDMGPACDADIAPHIENTTFFDIFEWVPYNNQTEPPCPDGYEAVNAGKYIIISSPPCSSFYYAAAHACSTAARS